MLNKCNLNLKKKDLYYLKKNSFFYSKKEDTKFWKTKINLKGFEDLSKLSFALKEAFLLSIFQWNLQLTNGLKISNIRGQLLKYYFIKWSFWDCYIDSKITTTILEKWVDHLFVSQILKGEFNFYLIKKDIQLLQIFKNIFNKDFSNIYIYNYYIETHNEIRNLVNYKKAIEPFFIKRLLGPLLKNIFILKNTKIKILSIMKYKNGGYGQKVMTLDCDSKNMGSIPIIRLDNLLD